MKVNGVQCGFIEIHTGFKYIKIKLKILKKKTLYIYISHVSNDMKLSKRVNFPFNNKLQVQFTVLRFFVMFHPHHVRS